MSVMPETSQSARGPYVASAEATSALYAWTAVFRGALVVKVEVQACVGGLGDGGEGGNAGGDGGANMQMHCLDEEHEPVLRLPKT